MTRQEMLDYLLSTRLYEGGDSDLYYEKHMIDDRKSVPIRELVKRFIEIDKEFNGKSWNILQILRNIDMVVPLEDRN